MFGKKFQLVFFLTNFYLVDSQRRIVDGEPVNVDKNYVVYLVKSPLSKLLYEGWLCGGAIVSEKYVITSAACINDVDYVFVIAGYKKYVSDKEIDNDPCTREKKKKVVYTCSPKDYKLKYEELDYWSGIDIALAKVESNFDFNDKSYEQLCSYTPGAIAVNYESKYQQPGTDSIALGWGHMKAWRKLQDLSDYNAPDLRYGATLILNKTFCESRFKDYTNMSTVIKRFMICTLARGNIDDKGEPILKTQPIGKGCTSRQMKVLGFEGLSCEFSDGDNADDENGEDWRRRGIARLNQTHNHSVSDVNKTENWDSVDGRRSGICQNDHGGPLITWVGSSEILIGIASVFRVSEKSECMGPYLFTSTYCTGMFLDCVLNAALPGSKSLRNDLCDKPASERGFETIERHISWKDHPSGPAENERIAQKKRRPRSKVSGKAKHFAENNKNVGHAAYKGNPENENSQVHGMSSVNDRYPPGFLKHPKDNLFLKNEPENVYIPPKIYNTENQNTPVVGSPQLPNIARANPEGYAERPQRPIRY